MNSTVTDSYNKLHIVKQILFPSLAEFYKKGDANPKVSHNIDGKTASNTKTKKITNKGEKVSRLPFQTRQ